MSDKKLFILGVDLGQTQDYTALTILERTSYDTGKSVKGKPNSTVWRSGRLIAGGGHQMHPIYKHHYQAQYLERLPIGTSYPAQVARIKQLSDELHKTTGTRPSLVADATGVGRPVLDMLRAAELRPAAVTITGGDTVSSDGSEYRVPKRDLVSAVQVLLQSERLKIAKALPEARTLTSELLAFKVSISLKGHDSYGNDVGPWRENPHDDMVLAVALTCWYGENVKSIVIPVPESTQFRTVR